MFSGYSTIFDPLQRIPVQHACPSQHFELRVTRWNTAEEEARGYLIGQSPCSSCDAQGRPVSPNYPTLEEAQAEALARPFRSRGGPA